MIWMISRPRKMSPLSDQAKIPKTNTARGRINPADLIPRRKMWVRSEQSGTTSEWMKTNEGVMGRMRRNVKGNMERAREENAASESR